MTRMRLNALEKQEAAVTPRIKAWYSYRGARERRQELISTWGWAIGRAGIRAARTHDRAATDWAEEAARSSLHYLQNL